MRQPQRDARQGRGANVPPPDGGGIDVRELTDVDVDVVDAHLPLSRLDSVQTYLVAWEEDTPIGHAHIAWQTTTLGIPEVQDVFVAERFRRRGVASELTRAAERLAGDRGYRMISLSFGIANEGARRLYEGLGYRRAELAPQRIRGTIVIRGRRVHVDDTLVYLVKDVGVDSGRPRSS